MNSINDKPHIATKNKDSSSSDKSTSINYYRCERNTTNRHVHINQQAVTYAIKYGHTAKVCKSKKRQLPPGKVTHQVTQDPPKSVPSEYSLFTMPGQQYKPLQAVINSERISLTLEGDTGAAVSIISDKTWNIIPNLYKLPLQPTQPYSKPTQERPFPFQGICPLWHNTMARMPPYLF